MRLASPTPPRQPAAPSPSWWRTSRQPGAAATKPGLSAPTLKPCRRCTPPPDPLATASCRIENQEELERDVGINHDRRITVVAGHVDRKVARVNGERAHRLDTAS